MEVYESPSLTAQKKNWFAVEGELLDIRRSIVVAEPTSYVTSASEEVICNDFKVTIPANTQVSKFQIAINRILIRYGSIFTCEYDYTRYLDLASVKAGIGQTKWWLNIANGRSFESGWVEVSSYINNPAAPIVLVDVLTSPLARSKRDRFTAGYYSNGLYLDARKDKLFGSLLFNYNYDAARNTYLNHCQFFFTAPKNDNSNEIEIEYFDPFTGEGGRGLIKLIYNDLIPGAIIQFNDRAKTCSGLEINSVPQRFILASSTANAHLAISKFNKMPVYNINGAQLGCIDGWLPMQVINRGQSLTQVKTSFHSNYNLFVNNDEYWIIDDFAMFKEYFNQGIKDSKYAASCINYKKL